jgi:Phosphotransferase enzyme family
MVELEQDLLAASLACRWRGRTSLRDADHMTPPDLVARPVAASLEELLRGASQRGPFAHSDSKSGVGFERVVIDGERYVLKHVHIDDDWTMRFFHETTCVPLDVWRFGLMDTAPDHIVHGMVGAAGGLGRDGIGAALLMRDLSDVLIPAGDVPITQEQHHQLLDAMAALSARMWGWRDTVGLLPRANRWLAFGDTDIADEERAGWPNAVPRVAAEGWRRFAQRAPQDVVAVIRSLRESTAPLVDATAATPLTFLHGDWKLGNLGIDGRGRTVLLDWTYCGEGPVCFELGWYLAINAARLPQAKEEAIAELQAALERHGVATAEWWERQLRLCLLGTVVLFGWEKALGNEQELGWWCDRAREGAAAL